MAAFAAGPHILAPYNPRVGSSALLSSVSRQQPQTDFSTVLGKHDSGGLHRAAHSMNICWSGVGTVSLPSPPTPTQCPIAMFSLSHASPPSRPCAACPGPSRSTLATGCRYLFLPASPQGSGNLSSNCHRAQYPLPTSCHPNTRPSRLLPLTKCLAIPLHLQALSSLLLALT